MDTHSTSLSAAELLEIETEFRRAAEAIAAGNDGRARVCSRRACGVALRAWYLSRGAAGAPADAQSLLKLAAAEPGLPAKAREAAGRLSAAVAGAGAPRAGGAADVAGSRISVDPVADAKLLIAGIVTPGAPTDGAGLHEGTTASGDV